MSVGASEISGTVCINCSQRINLVAGWMESSLAEKDLEVLVDTSLTMSQQCTLATKRSNSLLGYFMHCCQCVEAGATFSLLSPGEAHVEHCVQRWAPQPVFLPQKHIDILKVSPAKDHKGD